MGPSGDTLRSVSPESSPIIKGPRTGSTTSSSDTTHETGDHRHSVVSPHSDDARGDDWSPSDTGAAVDPLGPGLQTPTTSGSESPMRTDRLTCSGLGVQTPPEGVDW